MISIHRTILATLKIRTALLVAMTAGCLLSVSNAQARDIPENHPYVPVLKVAGVAQKAIREVNDYQGVLTKREYIGKKLHTQQMEIKVRHEPFSVYLKFREPFAGREVLFVEGQNNNQMLAHEGSGLASIVGTISLPLDSSRAM